VDEFLFGDEEMNYVILPCWNGMQFLPNALKSIRAQDINGGVRILAVNDNSLDNTGPYLRAQQDITTIAFDSNHYVSHTWNHCLKFIFDREKQDYALVLNQDVKLRKDTYRLLVADGGLFVTCVGTSSGALFPGDEHISGEKRPHPDYSCYLIRRECWERVGPFDETMRHWNSDGDHHIRMHQKGINAYCLSLPFWHFAAGSMKTAGSEDLKRLKDQALLDKAAFKAKWGCAMGTPEYNAMFEVSK
jgi:GT2 family glycosyltransferase